MTVINKPTGAIKLSEIANDNPTNLTNSGEREDMLENLERWRRALFDSLMNSNIICLSDGIIGWSTGVLTVNAGASLIFRIIGTPLGFSSKVVNIEFTPLANTNFSLAQGEMLYVEIRRSILESNSTVTLDDGVNGIGTSGQRIVRASFGSLPVLQDLNNSSPEGTIYIPVAARPYTSPTLYWCLSGIQWTNGMNGFVGQAVSNATVPVGSVIGLHRTGVAPLGTSSGTVNQAAIDLLAPGFWLCDGSTITDAESPLFGKTTPNLINFFPRGHTQSNQSGGQDSVTLSSAHIPSHNHISPEDAGHMHDGYNVTNGPRLRRTNTLGGSSNFAIRTAPSGSNQIRTDNVNESHTHTASAATSPSGGAHTGGAHENRPPFASLILIMRIK